MRKRDRFVCGMLLPAVILIVGMLTVANFPSGAGAAEFGALGVFLILLISLPIILIVNAIAIQGTSSKKICFKHGMIGPGIVLLAGIVYQSGLWDWMT